MGTPQGDALIGRKFLGLTVLALEHTTAATNGPGRSYRCKHYRCLCDCGNETVVRHNELGRTMSCGCKRWTLGGLTSRFAREYNSWSSMLARCENQADIGFHKYGALGIRVCERWHDFKAFLDDMGPRPPGTSLDRERNYGDYEPGNCRWSTPSAQANNRRTVNRRRVWKPLRAAAFLV